MNKSEIKIDSCYQVQVNYHQFVVRVDNIETLEKRKHGGYNLDGTPKPYKTTKRTIYLCMNVATKKSCTIKSASNFQHQVEI